MVEQVYIEGYTLSIINQIDKFEQQWKGTRFACVEEQTFISDLQDDNQQSQQFSQKYRGKNGDIKPLGLILYKKYMQILIVLFFVLTLLSTLITFHFSKQSENSKMFSLSNFSYFVIKISISNLPMYRVDNLSSQNLSTISKNRLFVVSWDMLSILLIFFFVIYIKVKSRVITMEYMTKSPHPHLYCLQIDNIQGASEGEVKRHFQQFGKVSLISGIYTWKNLILDLRNLLKLVNKFRFLKPHQFRYQQTLSKIKDYYLELSKTYFSNKKPELKSVFICFESIKDRNRVYDLYKYQINAHKLGIKVEQRMFFDTISKNAQITTSELEGQIQQKQILPNVKKCKFEPLTVNWQNCDIDKKSQLLKSICQFLLLVVVSFVILLGLFLLNVSSTHIKETPGETGFLALENNHQTKQVYTFCASLRYSQLKWFYQNTCAQFLQYERNRFVLILLFALMVALINLLTNRILWGLVAFRRYRTLAERNKFLITAIFIFSVINSAVLILFIRDSYVGPILRDIISKLLNLSKDQMKVTVYSSYNLKWYANIGTQLVMNYIVSLIAFPNFHIVLHWIRSVYRKMTAKETKPKRKPIFNYCTFYTISLKAIFFALMYSNSMPIFYFLALIALLMQKFIVKLLMKFFVDEPVFVDNHAIQVTTNLLPYALIVHCFTSIMFFSNEEILPNESSYYNMDAPLATRLLMKLESQFYYVLVIVLLCFYIYFQKQIIAKIVEICSSWSGNHNKNQDDQNKKASFKKREKKFSEILNNPAFLASYRMKDNPKYRILEFALKCFIEHMEKLRLSSSFQGGFQQLKPHIQSLITKTETLNSSDGTTFNSNRDRNSSVCYMGNPIGGKLENKNSMPSTDHDVCQNGLSSMSYSEPSNVLSQRCDVVSPKQ